MREVEVSIGGQVIKPMDFTEINFTRKEEKMEFGKKDLKDGMIITTGNGFQRMVVGDWLFDYEEVRDKGYIQSLNRYNGKVSSIPYGPLDATPTGAYMPMKVTYMGKVLWERKPEMVGITPRQACLILAKYGKVEAEFKDSDDGRYWGDSLIGVRIEEGYAFEDTGKGHWEVCRVDEKYLEEPKK